ncbi:MAG: Xaa-Pro peptidase family protein [Acidobacteriota bacterium]|nr:Xaa-Pro peptidase family protein [Acidobacteriota bacterium]
MNYRARQAKLLRLLEEQKLDALLVTHLPNVRYLSGFTGSAGVLLAAPRAVFFTDGRYTEQARQQVQGARVTIAKGSPLAVAARQCQGLKRVGYEADTLTVTQFHALQQEMGKGIRLVPASGLVERLRAVKDAGEIEAIRRAVESSSALFRPWLKHFKPGVTETELAARLEFMARKAGAEGMSFPTIVASGERSWLPHGVASPAALPAQGFVVLDYGIVLGGYCSDMTRTVHLGRATAAEQVMYGAVLEAQLAGISAVAPGTTAGEVDLAARKVLQKAKLGRYYTHSTGHGVGLEIHEAPRVGTGSQTVLEPGMVITIEPGAYVPGKGGVRIEDMVLVTATGYEVLTPVGKTLLEVHEN